MSQAGILSVEGSDPQIPTQFDTDSGIAIPIDNTLEIIGGAGIQTSGSGNTVVVSLTGGGAGIDSIAMQTGTSPVIPDGFGLVSFNGSSVASGTNPVRTNGTGANTLQLEVQTSQALAAADATKIGLSNFDSSSFAVAATGFVTASGTGLGKTITGDTGGALSPLANNWNIQGGAALSSGTNAAVTSGSGNTLTVTAINTAKWIVDPTANRGTHQTIASALTAASSGETIFIRPGTYTENLTLKAGVNICAFTCDALAPNVTIAGTLTMTTAGTVSISGIRLQTNSAALLAVTGSAASIVNLKDCYLNCTNNTGITYSSSSSSSAINITNCQGNLGTTGIGCFAHTSAGSLIFEKSSITNSGNSVTASTASAGALNFNYSIIAFPITTSSTNSFLSRESEFDTTGGNTTALTLGGSGIQTLINGFVGSGSASAVSVGSTLGNIIGTAVGSTNTNAITGAGTLFRTGILFTSSSSTINTTTQTNAGTIQGSKITAPTAGFLGEQITATGSSVAVSSVSAKTIASISLTAGVWDITGYIQSVATGGTSVGQLTSAGISTTDNTLPANPTTTWLSVGSWLQTSQFAPQIRATISATTTYYLVAFLSYTSTTCPTSGTISATRVG